jgi:hypothetical protein
MLDEARAWSVLFDSGEMSEEQRADFHAWLEESRNSRIVSEILTLVTLIQEVPEGKVASRQRISGNRVDVRGIRTRPAAAITVVAAIVSVGAGALGLSLELSDFFRNLFWSESSPPTEIYAVAETIVSCGAALAGSVLAALLFRQAPSK